MSKVPDMIARWERSAANPAPPSAQTFGGRSVMPQTSGYQDSQSPSAVPKAEVVAPPVMQQTPTRFIVQSDSLRTPETKGPNSAGAARVPSAPRWREMTTTDNRGATPRINRSPRIVAPTPSSELKDLKKKNSEVKIQRKQSTRTPSSTARKAPVVSKPTQESFDELAIDDNSTKENLEGFNVSPSRRSPSKIQRKQAVEPEFNEHESKSDDPPSPVRPRHGDLHSPDKPEIMPVAIQKPIVVGDDELESFGQIVAPRSQRKCRDILCLFSLLVTWLAMIVVSIVAAKTGNLLSLTHGTDFAGNVCGQCDGTLTDLFTCGRPLQAIDPSIVPNIFSVCVERCPMAGETVCSEELEFQGRNVSTSTKHCWQSFVDQEPLMNRCVPIQESNSTCLESPYLTFANLSMPNSANDPMCGTCLDPLFEPDGKRPKNPSAPDCRAKMRRYSSVTTSERLHPALDIAVSWSEMSLRWLADVRATWQSIAVGACIALVASISWMLLFVLCSSSLLWSTIVFLIGGTSFLAIQMLIAAGVIPQASSSQSNSFDQGEKIVVIGDSLRLFQAADSAQKETFAIAGWCMVVFSLVLLLVVCSLRRSISRAGSVMRGAAKAILTNTGLILVSLINFGIVMGLYTWGIAIVALLASAGRMKPSTFANSLVEGLNLTDAINDQGAPVGVDINPALIVFMILGIFWSIFFVRACGSMIIASVVASSKYKEKPPVGVFEAFYLVRRFHLGSAAFGSLVVAVLQLLRLILSYIDRKAKQVNSSNKTGFTKVGLALANCVLGCFAGFFRFATRFSYVVVAVRGESFCMATKTAFVLVSNGIFDFTASIFIAECIVFIGRILVVGLAAGCTWCMLFFGVTTSAGVTSLLSPVFTSALLAWFISGACFDLYVAAIDALIICKLDVRTRKLEAANNKDVDLV